MQEIKPTTTLDYKDRTAYILEDKDYLLIKSIQELTKAIQKMTMRLEK